MPPDSAVAWPVEPYRLALIALDTMRRLAHQERRLGLLLGDAGCGKSFAIRDFAHTDDRIAVVVVPPTAILTPRGLLEAVGAAIGIQDIAYSHQLRCYEQIHITMRSKQAFLIVDEADRLTPQIADLLRDIAELSEEAICLSGCRKLEAIIGRVPPVASRVVLRHVVKPVTAEDILSVIGHDSIFAQQHELMTWDESIIRAAVTETGGNLRQLQILLQQIEAVERNGTEVRGRADSFQTGVVRKLARDYLYRVA